MPLDRTRALRGALAGAAAAAVWAAQQPLDKRAFACDYDDVELLGKLVTRGPAWPAAGLALHVGNGAAFGATYAVSFAGAPALASVPPAARGLLAALVEHVALWPAGRLADRFHPARGELAVLTGNRRAFWQAAWRHALFGVLLGELEARLNGGGPDGDEDPAPAYAAAHSNGHGSLEDAVLGHPAS
jgi:hypothetical protein